MVKILLLTGQRGAGKTTWILNLANYLRNYSVPFYGLATPKIVMNDEVTGIFAKDLATDEREILAVKDEKPGMRMGPWRFFSSGIEFGENACAPESHSGLIIIDEIGPLEYKGLGFVKTLKRLRNGRYHKALVVVRPELISQIKSDLPYLLEIMDVSVASPGKVTTFFK